LAISRNAVVGFAPVLDGETRILILGTAPSRASLAVRQYYGNPHNQFWRLLTKVLKTELTVLAYEERLQRLLARGIGLWDVIAACEREGSLDSAIRSAKPNDFGRLRQQCPKLRRVCFNGKTAGKFEARFIDAGYTTLVLPSSSPAHARFSFAQKLAAWRRITGSHQ
jgi:hypoxanthine-DNA glycosylase